MKTFATILLSVGFWLAQAHVGGTARIGGTATLKSPVPPIGFSLAQAAKYATCSGCTTVNVTGLSAIGTGNTLVMTAGATNGQNGGISTTTVPSCSQSCGTWIVPAGCRGGNATLYGNVSCAYVLNTSPGATSITVTFSASNTYGVAVTEVIGNNAVLDGTPCNALRTSSLSTSQVGCSLTGQSGTSDYVQRVLMYNGGSAPSAISGGYNILTTQTAAGSSASHANLVNTASFAAPTWTTPNAYGGEAAIAFKTQ